MIEHRTDRRSAPRACCVRTATSDPRRGRRPTTRSVIARRRRVPSAPAHARPASAAGSPGGRGPRGCAITYFRLVPVASRKAAGVSGASRGHRQGARSQVAIRRHRVGQVRVRGSTIRPARSSSRMPAGGQPAPRAASARAGGAATASAASSRSIAAASAGSGAAARTPRVRTIVAVANQPLLARRAGR